MGDSVRSGRLPNLIYHEKPDGLESDTSFGSGWIFADFDFNNLFVVLLCNGVQAQVADTSEFKHFQHPKQTTRSGGNLFVYLLLKMEICETRTKFE